MSDTTLESLLDKIYFGPGTNREKGDRFEALVAKFLVTDPVFAAQFVGVEFWGDYARRTGVSARDLGIDLVAKLRGGGRRLLRDSMQV